MPPWFKRQNAIVDAVVAAGVTFGMSGWFAAVLHGSGLMAVWVALFGLFQLLRFVNALMGELQWVRMHEALLREKKRTPEPAQHDGYREAAVIEELPSADEVRLEEEVPRRRRYAQASLAIAGALVWLMTLIPGFVFGVWQVAGAATFIAAAMALFLTTMHAMRAKQREMSRRDYFIQHLDRDTKAMLDPQRRVRVDTENANLRAGVDFGVPAEELDAEDAEPPAKRSAR